jgi:hypothetical protein
MSANRPVAGLLALLLLLSAAPARGQAPAGPPGNNAPAPASPGPPSSAEASDSIGEASSPFPVMPPRPPAAVEGAGAPPPPQDFFQQIKLDYTFLPALGGNSLEINDVEASTTLAVPTAGEWAPVLLTPGLAAHFWEGPDGATVPGVPGLPRRLYDAYVDVGWRPRLAKWLFADLGITPGVYSDFRDVSARAFQLRGRGLAIVAFSPQLQVVLGALYVNRNRTKVLPAGGIIWNPDEDTKLQMVFPAPKLARRVATVGDTSWWAYLAGEFGGGRWVVERPDGGIDSVDYTDVRANLGLEWLRTAGLKGHLEVGYVFARRVNFTSDTPDFHPDSTVMLRAGLSY